MVANHGCTLQAVRWMVVDGMTCARCPVCGRIIAKETDGMIYWRDTEPVESMALTGDLKKFGAVGQYNTLPLNDPVAGEELDEEKKNLLAVLYFAYADEVRSGYMEQHLGVLSRLKDAMRMLGASEKFMEGLPPRA